MRKIFDTVFENINHYLNTNYYEQMWFKYHVVFFGCLIIDGKKLKAFNNFLMIKYYLKEKELYDPSIVFVSSLMKLSPDIYFVTLKLGGAPNNVPLPISEKKKVILAVKWVIKLLRDKLQSISVLKIVDVIVSTLYDSGIAVDKKNTLYVQGGQNRHLLKFFK